jgi:dihydrodipicolinate synthase/N-acetylneuraminate lyase/glycine cleavage system aminomethyltransferase T
MKKFDAAKRFEHGLIRNKVAMADFTMGLIEITGEDALEFLNGLCVNDLAKSSPGKVLYTGILDENAVFVDDVTVYCFSAVKYWMITAFKANTLVWFENHRNDRSVRFEDLSDRIALWSIQGPDSRRLLSSYLKYDISALKYYTFMENEAGGIPVILSRTGFTGELGYEIFSDNMRINRITSDLERIGIPFGARILSTNVGFESIPTEKGLVMIRDFRGTNPLELGMEKFIKWNKSNFTGKARLEEIRKQGVKRLLTGFVAEDDEIDIELESPVKSGNTVIGKVTTANYGYTVELSIGYCLIEAKYAQTGSKVTIVSGGREVTATLCERVFYDKERTRINPGPQEAEFTVTDTKAFLQGGKEKVFKGLFAAMATPMNRDEKLDAGGTAKLIEHLIESGLDGILIGGSSGEYPAQSIEERKLLFKTASDAAKGRVKLAACCSTNTTLGTKELCSYAGEVGIDFALIMTPYDPPVSEPDMIEFYKEIASYSKPGVIVYHYPDYTGVTLSVDAIVELSKEPNIAGIKNVADLSSTVAIINKTQNESFGVLSGSDEVFLGALACGSDGFMGVGACVAPKLCRELFDSFKAGENEKAKMLHKRLCKIIEVIFGGPFPGTLKAALELQGFACGRPRKPCPPADIVCRRTILSVLVETGVIKS